MQVNLHDSEADTTELTIHPSQSKVDVALIRNRFGIKGYTLFVTHTMQKLRTCIPARNELNFIINSSFITGEMTVIDRSAKSKRKLTLPSIYMPYETADPPSIGVQELTSFSRRRGGDLVLDCDANEPHYQWGSLDVNKKGESIFEFIVSNDL